MARKNYRKFINFSFVHFKYVDNNDDNDDGIADDDGANSSAKKNTTFHTYTVNVYGLKFMI